MSKWKSIRSNRTGLLAGVITCLALAGTAGSSAGAVVNRGDTANKATAVRQVTDTASRSRLRSPDPVQSTKATQREILAEQATTPASAATTAPAPAQTTAPATAPLPSPTVTTPPVPPKPKPPAQPTPVGGLTQIQMNNAQRIVAAGVSMGLPTRAFVLAIMCALQESNLLNLASTALPESFNYPNEGSGSDHDSVGLFQQRPSSGWGAVSDLMNPDYAAKAFYNALLQVPGWDTMELTLAIQTVQVSAFPYAYAPHESLATTIVNTLI
jgi:hypothetical protein